MTRIPVTNRGIEQLNFELKCSITGIGKSLSVNSYNTSCVQNLF